MRQIVQSFNAAETRVAEVPAPLLRARGILIRTRASLVSAGTERMVVNFAAKNLVQKAQARPDLVRQVLDKVQNDGVLATLEGVRNRLAQPLPLGYSSAGVVVAVGNEANAFQIGDRVACAGGGFAAHAEIVYIPRNLATSLPEGVPFEHGCFASIGAIALQGIRQAEAVIGHNVAVIGLGLLGQITVQMLKAAGCRVFGIDVNPDRVALAIEMGADGACPNESALATGRAFVSSRGFDAVLITADTPSSEPVQLAGELARSRAIIVAVGAVGMEIPRKIYYEKELDFRLSRSYGPGRYDPDYEAKGHDYPYDYVRWTEQRNMEAFVQLLAESKLNIERLITHRFPIDEAPQAYDVITGKTSRASLGVIVTYPHEPDTRQRIEIRPVAARPQSVDRVRLGVIGAGNFANATLLPTLRELVDFTGIASGGGVTARAAADRFGFRYCTTDAPEILNDPAINTVALLTRHNLHAAQVIAALGAGKHVFVEKPLCLTEGEVESIVAAYRSAATRPNSPALMVGFNRRFAPFVVALKDELRNVKEPLMLAYRVNAGFIPREHWVHDLTQGGGRLLGEGCHFIDLLIHLADSAPDRITTRVLPDNRRYSRDNLLVTLQFVNGSIGTLTYVANGDKSFGKELLEVFGGGLAARLDNFRKLVIRNGARKVQRTARLRANKGYRAEWQAFSAHITGKAPAPIAFDDIVLSTRTALAAHRSLITRESVQL